MLSYLEYQEKSRSLKDVLDTVKAEEKISASQVIKLRATGNALENYLNNLLSVLQEVNQLNTEKKSPFFQEKEAGLRIMMVIGSDKGLVGGRWHQIVEETVKIASEYDGFVVIGARLKDFFEEEKLPVIQFFKSESGEGDMDLETKVNLALVENFLNGKYKRIDILNFTSISMAEQRLVKSNFLPIDLSELSDQKTSVADFPVIEPSILGIYAYLVRKYLEIVVRKTLFASKLSELSSRTLMMEEASVRTQGLIDKNKHTYLLSRRKLVTSRQLETYSNSLNNDRN